ncbi:MAG: TIGR04282 family arsenosugar biosynthesis glycosyltransferase [Myxococcota bacterium]|nr:TIGR04282 family arsenosugar biosynthesis glycosyltransferase [Myxococcota bacterium]
MNAASIMAKVPIAGEVKTRLSKTLGAEGATALHVAMAEDVAELCEQAGVTYQWVVAGERSHPWVQALTAPIQTQASGSLGNRIAQAIGSRGFALGCDAPTLPPAWITQAARSEADLVLGPTRDGGCWTIGWNTACPDWFEGIPWSTDEVFALLLQRAQRKNLVVEVLEPWYDVDEPDDVLHLANHLESLPEDRARRTRRLLANLGV